MIQELVSVSIMIVCYLGYICAVDKFCKKYLEISRINERVFVLFLFGGRGFMNFMNRYCVIPDIFFILLNRIFFIGLVLLLFQRNTEKKILAASILITVTTLVQNFFVSFLSCLALFYLHTVKSIAVPFLREREFRLIVCISLVIAVLAIHWAAKHFVSVFYCKTRKWYVILAIPLLAVTAVIDVANWGASKGILIRSGGNMGLYYDQILSHAEFCVLTALSMFAAGFYVFGMDQIYLEQKKSSQYHLQIAAYKMLEEQYGRAERLRHDLKNHIIALLGLLENKEWEKIENYLKNMEGSAALGTREEITGNRIVDVLLYQKRNIAEEKNIIWECDVHIPGICHINEFDLCVLFGNILDNAVEACERLQRGRSESGSQPFINIQGKMVKKCFFFFLKNSADMSDKNKVKSAGKANPEEHGIGLLNISDVVHRYNGVMNIDVQNGVFLISVLIPLGNAGHDIKQAV